MKLVYRILAYLVCLGVVLQAAAIALAFFGLGSWLESGGTLDKSAIESGTHFSGDGGLAFHGTDGMMIIPAIGLLLVISSFFTKTVGATRWALLVLGCIVIQVALGMLAHTFYILGAIHGLFAFGVLAAGALAAIRVQRAPATARSAASVAPAPRATASDLG